MSSTGSNGADGDAGSSRPPVATAPRSDRPRQKRARAARLIGQVLDSGVPASELAAAIVVSERVLAHYRSGRIPVPLDRQLCLALYVIEHVPAARRAAFTLRAQVEAEVALARGATEVHRAPPISHRWP